MKEQFLAELKALLSKYNAEISFEPDSGSDTHGFSGSLVIDHRIGNSFKYEELYNSNGNWELTQYEL